MYSLCERFLRLRDMLSRQKCNNIIKLLNKCIYVVDEFNWVFSSNENIPGWLQNVTHWRVAEIRFQKKPLHRQNGIFCTLYSGNGAKILQEQIRSCPSNSIVHIKDGTNSYNRRLNSDLGRKACKAVEQLITFRKDASVSWKKWENDSVPSSSGPQRFTDSSQVSLSAGTLQL